MLLEANEARSLFIDSDELRLSLRGKLRPNNPHFLSDSAQPEPNEGISTYSLIMPVVMPAVTWGQDQPMLAFGRPTFQKSATRRFATKMQAQSEWTLRDW